MSYVDFPPVRTCQVEQILVLTDFLLFDGQIERLKIVNSSPRFLLPAIEHPSAGESGLQEMAKIRDLM